MNGGGTLSVPVSVRRAWEVEGQTATLYWVLVRRRLVLFPADELAAYLAERASDTKGASP